MSDAAALLERAAGRLARRRVGVVVGHLAPDGTMTVRGTGRTSLPDGGTPDALTRFEIGSITKTFTGLTLARAVAAGQLDLDMPVGDLVPEVADLGRDGTPVTLRHLATHTSGLPRVHVPMLRGTLDAYRGLDPYRDHSEEALLGAIRSGRLRRTPGTGRQAYSNSGFGLLGIALARHAGLPFAELVARDATEPLGLAATGTSERATSEQAARAAVGHHRRRTPAAPWNLGALPGAGALHSTATDLLGWARAHLDPPPGELGEAVRLAVAEHGPRIGLAWQRTVGEAERRRGRDLVIWHSGGTGGFRSALCLRPAAGDAVVVLTNHGRSVALAAFRLLAALSR
ncbi:beta-lactamase family protein [Isoptericola sp. S6320L]|uniref:serine hydrolase domain-containing protein n=1 Tax=Isoptericola sp. S6320L TaxID=2926411 RepID=UPI001FF3289E|nr:serine hydrolase domain-containing protein [Isoptericola sp. S6320L]MCK0118146.1 beta-lactamase family protein [Isoptericola sp. S6320L]